MEVIDDEGRLFGVVNVVDAVAVLLVVAVVVAGVSLVLSGDTEPDRETRVVTVSLGELPGDAAALVEPGAVSVAGVDATSTDVYRTPASGDRALVFLRVRAPGRVSTDGFAVDGRVLRYGAEVDVVSPDYEFVGNVTRLGGPPTFETVTRTVTVKATVSPPVADAVATGDIQQIANEPVARVTAVERELVTGEETTIRVRLRVTARRTDGTTRYGGRPLRLGAPFEFGTATYQFGGRVIEVSS